MLRDLRQPIHRSVGVEFRLQTSSNSLLCEIHLPILHGRLCHGLSTMALDLVHLNSLPSHLHTMP